METDCLAACVHVLLCWNPQSTACMDLSQHRGNHTECIHKSHHAIIWGLSLEFHLCVSLCKCSYVNQQADKQKLLRRRSYSGSIAVTHNQLEENCEHFGDSIPHIPSPRPGSVSGPLAERTYVLLARPYKPESLNAIVRWILFNQMKTHYRED